MQTTETDDRPIASISRSCIYDNVTSAIQYDAQFYY